MDATRVDLDTRRHREGDAATAPDRVRTPPPPRSAVPPASFLDGLDPRTRLLAALALVVGVVVPSSLLVLSLALVGALAGALASGVPLRRTLARIAGLEGIVVAMLLVLPFVIPGEPILVVGPLAASAEGLARAAAIALKANAAVLVVLALLGGLEPVRIGEALRALRVPAPLVLLLLMTVRYRDVLAREAARLSTAMRARGFRARTSLHTFRAIGHFAGMLLVRSVERADRILAAMRCRGFTGEMPAPEGLAFGPRDAAFAAAAGAAAGALAVAGVLA